MTYFLPQTLLCLLIAVLLGLLVGWWLGRRKAGGTADDAGTRLGKDLDHCRDMLARSEADLEVCRDELAASRERERAAAPRDAEPAALADLAAVAAGAGGAEPDDLTRVEGIGPKIAGLLNAAGIYTWGQLARTEVDSLQSVLNEAGPRYRIHDPSTWPEQAALAAAGSWDGLEELQDRLKGGREG